MPFSARQGFFASTETELWTPANTDTLLWLDGQDSANITESGGNVSAWTSKGNLSITLSQANTSLQPTYNATANAVVFNGSGDVMSVASRFGLGANPDLWWGIVSKLNAVGGGVDPWGLIGDEATNGHLSPTVLNSGFRWSHKNGHIFYDQENAYIGVNTLYMWGRIAGQDYGNGSIFYRNGSEISSTTETNPTNSPADTTANFQIGAYTFDPTFALDADIYEMVICESQNTILRESLEGYLAWRWGLEGNLPSDHRFKSGPPRI